MIRDVFYYNNKPNVHPREKHATSLEDARRQATTEHFWIINEYCDYRNFDWDFDFDFLPDEDVWAKDHNNVWPSQHQKDSGTWLCPKEHSDVIIYRNDVDVVIRKKIKSEHWVEHDNIDASFDYSWHPDSTDPPYIYVWGSKFMNVTEQPALEYRVPGATELKYMHELVPIQVEWDKWEIPDDIDQDKFDFTWRPDDNEPPFIWQFGTQWQKTGGPRYIVPGATEIKYTSDQHAIKLPDKSKFRILGGLKIASFDYSWHPDDTSPPYNYQFGTESHSAEDMPAIEYFMGTDIEAKFMHSPIAYFNLPESQTTASILNNVELDMFYVYHDDHNQYDMLHKRFGDRVQKTRYFNSWVDTINRCLKRATTELVWILDSRLDYSEFDFGYYPNIWQKKMVHIFGTQWTHWGNTYLVNRETFENDTRYIKVIEHLSNLNFVKHIRAKKIRCDYDIVLIDHGNDEVELTKQQLAEYNPKIVTYDNSYLETLRQIVNILETKKEHYAWVCSSVCDYSNFDFTYTTDFYATENLHVFASDKQKFGDTFLIDVNKARTMLEQIENLTEYEKVNYVNQISAKRYQEPIFFTEHDTHANELRDDINFPYYRLVTHDNRDINIVNTEPVSLWDNTTPITILTKGATQVIVPKSAKKHVKHELYDYPYIKHSNKLGKSRPLDIVFLSNNEKCADENYEHLLNVTKDLENRVVRVDGVNGRKQAYHASAEASNTPWYFAVFAKLRIDQDFDFSWQPDRLQADKHYIFHALNPVNKLVYGHQAMIAYHKRLVLNNTGRGLDFTLDDEHETVPLLSGVAYYNTDEFSTWRTAFREAIKLRANDDMDSRHRLHVWLTEAEGDYAEYSLQGANDAVRYYQSVDGDFDQLKLSYEWDWLRERFLLTSNLI